MSQKVLLVSYDANMLSTRMNHYIVGGMSPSAAKTTRVYMGCRDKTVPVKHPLKLEGKLTVYGKSLVWAGSGLPCYKVNGDDLVYAAGYEVTVEQLNDVYSQMTGDYVGSSNLSLEDLLAHRANVRNTLRGRVVSLGVINGLEAFTFSKPSTYSLNESVLNGSYRNAWMAGLIETHKLSDSVARAYVNKFDRS